MSSPWPENGDRPAAREHLFIRRHFSREVLRFVLIQIIICQDRVIRPAAGRPLRIYIAQVNYWAATAHFLNLVVSDIGFKQLDRVHAAGFAKREQDLPRLVAQFQLEMFDDD
jgi:hypothetical protein